MTGFGASREKILSDDFRALRTPPRRGCDPMHLERAGLPCPALRCLPRTNYKSKPSPYEAAKCLLEKIKN